MSEVTGGATDGPDGPLLWATSHRVSGSLCMDVAVRQALRWPVMESQTTVSQHPFPIPSACPRTPPCGQVAGVEASRILVPSVLLCHHPALTHTCVHGPHSHAHTCAHTFPKGKFKTTFPALYSEWDSSFR